MKQVAKIKPISRILLVIGAICIVASIFLPMWQIELYAPQYPEGLELLIYPDSLAGDVEIINGLNHYIGMKTLHTSDFMEFRILPYLLGFFALCFLVVAILGNKKLPYYLFGLYLLFSIVSMADFYRWNYNYGHNLDPNAAIKVPGMAYQPPLLGYKQLLNFGAYSIPDTGGFLFITAGVLLVIIVLIESGVMYKIFRRKKKATGAMLLALLLIGCSPPGPRPVEINKDECAFCKMTITHPNFAAQLITDKGRHYLFDDISCMADYKKAESDVVIKDFYVADFTQPSEFINIDQAYLFHSDSLRSPMGGNIAAFADEQNMNQHREQFNGTAISWNQVISNR